jgi:hypothetical protein
MPKFQDCMIQTTDGLIHKEENLRKIKKIWKSQYLFNHFNFQVMKSYFIIFRVFRGKNWNEKSF